jgi:hypothetical protein
MAMLAVLLVAGRMLLLLPVALLLPLRLAEALLLLLLAL